MTHTPGPLTALPSELYRDDWYVASLVHGTSTLAQVFGWHGWPSEANARLFAAAPDLLAAVEAFLALQTCGRDTPLTADEIAPVLALALAARAKAVGE